MNPQGEPVGVWEITTHNRNMAYLVRHVQVRDVLGQNFFNGQAAFLREGVLQEGVVFCGQRQAVDNIPGGVDGARDKRRANEVRQ